MNKDFIDILKKLIKEQGKEALTNHTKCKSLLRDYVKNEFKKETRFILLAVEDGTAKTIDKTDDLATCKKIQIRELQENQGLAPEIAADIVNVLALVLRNDKTIAKAEISNAGKVAIEEKSASQQSLSYDKGIEYFNNKDYDKAINEFTEAIQQNPKHSLAYAYRARAYNSKDNYNMGFKDANQAIDCDPECAMGYFARGVVYKFKNETVKALADYDKAIELDPELTVAYKNRGDLHQSQDNFDCAFEDFSQVIYLDPNDADAYSWRGTIYAAKGKIDQAIADFSQAIRCNPKNGYLYFQRGMAFHKQGDFILAIPEYENALNLNLHDSLLPHVKQMLELAKRRQRWDI